MTQSLPTYFISHGGGPWPWLDDWRQMLHGLELSLQVPTVPEYQQRQLIARRSFQPTAQTSLVEGQPRQLDVFRGVPDTVDPARELIVRDLAVVDDPARTYEPCTGAGTPMGAWTFGRLMTEMANEPVTGIHPSDFAEAWMQQWMSDRTINGFNVPRRDIGTQNFLAGWPRGPDGRGSTSGRCGSCPTSSMLEMGVSAPRGSLLKRHPYDSAPTSSHSHSPS